MNSIDEIQEIYSQTLKLIYLYSSHGLPIPFGLKGNLGEFHVHLELLKRFPNSLSDFRGGSFPGVDILLDGVRIQVKTQIKHPPVKFKGGWFDFEGSPTIKKATLDEMKCDFIILVILYAVDNFSSIKKTHAYVFDKNDFRHFNTKFCWSGNSKGDYTIFNILSVEGTPPTKLKEKIDHYNTPEYKQLFKDSKDNWAKLESKLPNLKAKVHTIVCS